MRSKWYRSIVAVALVTAFAGGTVAVSGGHQPFTLGQIGGNPLQGMTITAQTGTEPQGFTMIPVGLMVAAAALARAISPFRQGTIMSLGGLDESIFD